MNVYSGGASQALLLASSNAVTGASYDNYAGGMAYSAGTGNGFYDLTFSEGTEALLPAATPEPSGLVLFGTGALGVLGTMRQRLRRRP